MFSGTPLNGQLGMTLAPNGDILTANGLDRNIVETKPDATSAIAVQADPSGCDLFGLTLTPDQTGVYFVDDGTNTLDLFAPAP